MARDIGVTEIDDVLVQPNKYIYPAAAVLPMGWAWSLHVAQSINVHTFRLCSSLSDAPFMTSRSPAFGLRQGGAPGRYVYVDNLGAVGSARQPIADGLEEATSVFGSRGLLLHDREMMEGAALLWGSILTVSSFRVVPIPSGGSDAGLRSLSSSTAAGAQACSSRFCLDTLPLLV